MSRSATRAEPPCSTCSADLGEPLCGTASTIRRWILVEHPGPWSAAALHSDRLPEGLGSKLRKMAAEAKARVVLIRPCGRRQPGPSTCFLAHSGPNEQWMERVIVDDLTDIGDLDVTSLASGQRSGHAPVTDPMFFVCTHGRHDPCCAERGRPVAKALSDAFPNQTWEVSHIGGDRFAGNVVCLPSGIYLGRVNPSTAVDVARNLLNDRIDLQHFRGRSSLQFIEQAAEWYARAHTTSFGIDHVALDGRQTVRLADGRQAEQISLRVHNVGRVTVRLVRRHRGPARSLTCFTTEAEPPAFELAGIEVQP